jgi:Xaa-Pro aminopeptidase
MVSDRLVEAMAAHGLDALVLGRPANVRFASGARLLWTAGARPFAPGCVVIGATGGVHVMATWEDSVPDGVERFDLTWNPAILARSLSAIPGLAGAARVGVDGMTPLFASMFAGLTGELVDAWPALWMARSIKTKKEIAGIKAACEVAEAAATTVAEALKPGVSDRELIGIFAESVYGQGALLATDRLVLGQFSSEPGQLVALDACALLEGYEGGVGRTFPVGGAWTAAARDTAARCRRALDAVVDSCRPGRSGGDLRRAWGATGEPFFDDPLAYGVGLGAEPPVVDVDGLDVVLAEGCVLSVQAWVTSYETGGCFARDVVLVTGGDPQLLTRAARSN